MEWLTLHFQLRDLLCSAAFANIYIQIQKELKSDLCQIEIDSLFHFIAQ